MLYDQAQLTPIYDALYIITKKEIYKKASIGVLKYVQEQMTSPEGGFYSAEDADSLPTEESDEKKEGAFYVWSYDGKTIEICANCRDQRNTRRERC